MDTPIVVACGLVAAVGGAVAAWVKVRNALKKSRNLDLEHKNLVEAANKPGPKVVQRAGGNAVYIDQSKHYDGTKP